MSEIEHDPAPSGTSSASHQTAAARTFPFALAVDSSDANLDALQRLLAARGIGLLRAHSAANGVALAKHHVPDVIIADLSVRGLSTLDFLVAAKSDPRLAHVPLIVGSVALLHADHARRHCLSLGADGFLPYAADRGVHCGPVRLGARAHRAAACGRGRLRRLRRVFHAPPAPRGEGTEARGARKLLLAVGETAAAGELALGEVVWRVLGAVGVERLEARVKLVHQFEYVGHGMLGLKRY